MYGVRQTTLTHIPASDRQGLTVAPALSFGQSTWTSVMDGRSIPVSHSGLLLVQSLMPGSLPSRHVMRPA